MNTVKKTAKAIALWCGNSSTGVSIEVVLSDDGAFFFRDYGWNGFGNAWSKWQLMDASEVKHPISYVNAYDGERHYYNADKSPNFNIVEWGFANLRGGHCKGLTYRLPRYIATDVA